MLSSTVLSPLSTTPSAGSSDPGFTRSLSPTYKRTEIGGTQSAETEPAFLDARMLSCDFTSLSLFSPTWALTFDFDLTTHLLPPYRCGHDWCDTTHVLASATAPANAPSCDRATCHAVRMLEEPPQSSSYPRQLFDVPISLPSSGQQRSPFPFLDTGKHNTAVTRSHLISEV